MGIVGKVLGMSLATAIVLKVMKETKLDKELKKALKPRKKGKSRLPNSHW